MCFTICLFILTISDKSLVVTYIIATIAIYRLNLYLFIFIMSNYSAIIFISSPNPAMYFLIYYPGMYLGYSMSRPVILLNSGGMYIVTLFNI
jgi:hypothetical protein